MSAYSTCRRVRERDTDEQGPANVRFVRGSVVESAKNRRGYASKLNPPHKKDSSDHPENGWVTQAHTCPRTQVVKRTLSEAPNPTAFRGNSDWMMLMVGPNQFSANTYSRKSENMAAGNEGNSTTPAIHGTANNDPNNGTYGRVWIQTFSFKQVLPAFENQASA
jgi:hypothetical protein